MTREDKLQLIAEGLEARFGGTMCTMDYDSDWEASVYFRAVKSDRMGRRPAVFVLRLVYRRDLWYFANEDVSLPVRDELRKLGVEQSVAHS